MYNLGITGGKSMCVRYFIQRNSEKMVPYVEKAQESPLFQRFVEKGKELVRYGEVRPTDVVHAVAFSRKGEQAVFPMRWGFQMAKGPLMVNARVESAAAKPTFRDSWKEHRCAVPASQYFEWMHYEDPAGKKRTGDKYSIRSSDSRILWLCGLYRIEDGLPVFVILTRDASDPVGEIHDRMPMILPERDISEWIRPDRVPELLLGHAIEDLVVEKTQ